jgi:hypothetical protein
MKRVYYVRDYARDSAINKLLGHFGMSNSLIIYNIVTCNPIEIVAQILLAKFGLSKAIITLILIFLL